MDWVKLGKKLLFVPCWAVLLMTAVSAGALVYVFSNSLDTSPVAYAAYIFAFYTLCVLCATCWKRPCSPSLAERCRQTASAL